MKWRLSISHIFFCPSGTQTLLESPLTNFTLGLLNGVIGQNPQSAVKMDLLPLFITYLNLLSVLSWRDNLDIQVDLVGKIPATPIQGG